MIGVTEFCCGNCSWWDLSYAKKRDWGWCCAPVPSSIVEDNKKEMPKDAGRFCDAWDRWHRPTSAAE